MRLKWVNKNTVVSCIYRTPGSSVKTFIDKLEESLVRFNDNKVSIICGDYNINLLNISTDSNCSNFLDTVYFIYLLKF